MSLRTLLLWVSLDHLPTEVVLFWLLRPRIACAHWSSLVEIVAPFLSPWGLGGPSGLRCGIARFARALYKRFARWDCNGSLVVRSYVSPRFRDASRAL